MTVSSYTQGKTTQKLSEMPSGRALMSLPRLCEYHGSCCLRSKLGRWEPNRDSPQFPNDIIITKCRNQRICEFRKHALSSCRFPLRYIQAYLVGRTPTRQSNIENVQHCRETPKDFFRTHVCRANCLRWNCANGLFTVHRKPQENVGNAAAGDCYSNNCYKIYLSLL